ncbi:MAG: FHA domain-containing protein, partial [Kiritimatiellia bacterium]|nr:FHA domain-containing protein [Kiritimatiellia bacterium]
PDGLLHVADLASTNETRVNDKPIQDVALQVGDRVNIGETDMQVVCRTLTAGGTEPAGPHPVIDLGLQPADGTTSAARPGGPGTRRTVLWSALLLILVAAGAAIFLRWSRGGGRTDPAAVSPGFRTLELAYEKVQASSNNIFFYSLTLRDRTLAIQVHNLRDDRIVNREKKVDSSQMDELARAIESGGFFTLSEEYSGRPMEVWESMDLTVTTGRRTRRVRVVNQSEPAAFREIRQKIEEFGQNEIGLTALALPPEKLLELARDAWQAGQNFYNQREVRNDNLARAIRSFTEVEWYLETVEPKPPFHAEAVARLAEAVRLLQERYEEALFLAERAIRVREWNEANKHLRVILEMLPDRTDERYRTTERKLMDVQNRMSRR